MIVVDASAVVSFLLRGRGWHEVAEVWGQPGEEAHAPHLLDVEVVHALRRLEREGTIGATRAEQALTAFLSLDVIRHPHPHLMSRAWRLSHNLTGYDAMYVSLAEGLEAPLLTCDRRLAAAPGHRAEIRVV
jgi:predicted nucleic acid-binding protein